MTTILIKKKDTAGAPAPGDLTNAAGGTEIAVNTATKRIYTKDSGGNVVELGTNPSTIDATTIDTLNLEVTNIKARDGTASITLANSTGVASFTANPTISSGTANGVAYLNGSKVLTTGSALTFSQSGGMFSTTFNINSLLGSATYKGGIVVTEDDAAFTLYGGSGYKLLETQGFSTPSALKFYANNTEQMRLTSTGLGIGTSSPAYKLDVNIGNNSGAKLFKFTGATAGGSLFGYSDNGGVGITRTDPYSAMLYFNTSGGIEAYTNSTLRATIDTSGNLGLGVTPSAWGSLFKSIDVGTTASFVGSSGGANVFNNAFLNTAQTDYIYKTTAAATRYLQSSGAHQWFTAPSGTAGNAISFSQVMTLDASGNLGIGTSSPTAKLDVYREIRVTQGLAEYRFRITNTDGNGRLLVDGDTSALIFGTSGAGTGATATERMRIDSSGNLLVGITSGNFHRFAKDSASDFAVQSANTSGTTPYGHVITFTAAAPNDATSMFLRCDDTGQTGRIQLRSNGGIANFSANNVNLSDRREKTNFAPAKFYLETICAIPVQTFNYIDQNMEEDPGLTLGVVAQDVQAVAPELVMESNWGTKEEPKQRLSIYQTDLQYALMKCIQEQQALITSLTARVAALESN